MLGLFAAFMFLIYLAIYFLSRKIYLKEINALNKKEFPLKGMLVVGLWFMDIFRFRFSGKYEQKLILKLTELRGYKNARYYLRIHLATKLNLIIIICLIFSAISSFLNEINFKFFIICATLMVGAFILTDRELDEMIKKRHVMLEYDFPDFVNKLVLLINAGLGVSRAWTKIISDSNVKRPLYEELRLVLLKIDSGKSEQLAYEELARACRVTEITKFVSILLQHSKKGNSELVSALRLQSFECWQMRKNISKRLGEESSIKMIFPLMLTFIAVLMIVAAPAVIYIIF